MLANFPILIPAFTARVSQRLPRLEPSSDELTLAEAAKNYQVSYSTQIFIDSPLAISEDLLNIRFIPNAGGLTSEPGYPLSLRATFIHGSDYLRRDQDGEHVRLEVTSTARSEDNGSLVRFSYNGIVAMAGDEGKVIRGDNNASTTGFGNACEFAPFESCSDHSFVVLGGSTLTYKTVVQIRFETEDPSLQAIEDKMYVGSGRFIVEDGEPVVVEYKISEVASACGGVLNSS